jgi:alpha-mannosidase
VGGSDAECAFAVVRRGLDAEGGPSESALPTFPARRFVDCSDGRAGLAVVSDGLLEYEVTGGGTELAVTVLRSVGYLARLEPSLRPNPAGPPVPVEGAQLAGTVRRRFGLLLHQGDWRAAGLHGHADQLLVPLEAATVLRTTATAPPAGQTLDVNGAEVSAVMRAGDTVVVRLYNPSPQAVTATLSAGGRPSAGVVVDLDGRAQRACADGRVDLRPWEIATVNLEPGL